MEQTRGQVGVVEEVGVHASKQMMKSPVKLHRMRGLGLLKVEHSMKKVDELQMMQKVCGVTEGEVGHVS